MPDKRFVLRNGKPAYLCAPPRRRAQVTMEEWLSRHMEEQPRSLFRWRR